MRPAPIVILILILSATGLARPPDETSTARDLLRIVKADRDPEAWTAAVEKLRKDHPEVRDQLFQPFTTTRADGVGLGLSLTLRIVSLHGGRVGLENHPEGGVQATVVFPQEGG